MNTIQNLFQQAQLAEAAYANFSDSNISMADALQDKQNGGSFSQAQATTFAAEWRVVNQYTASAWGGLTDGSGFSATVFEKLGANGVGTGQYSFAARGTAGATDLLADAGDVLADGIALDQVVDMYNYWQSLTHSGVYQVAKLETSLAETAALNLLMPGAARDAAIAALKASGAILDSTLGGLTIEVRRIVKGDSNILLADTLLATGSGVLAGTASVSVDGHSLGGHLAMAFSRLFPNATNSVVAVNGAGFDFADSNVNALFAALGGAAGFDANKITNVVGSAAMNLVSQDWLFLQQPAGRSEIYTESYLPGSGTMLGHGSSQMTDTLAVYSLLSTLDPSLNTDPNGINKITDILKASSNIASNTLESVVANLGKLFQVNGAAGFNSNEFDANRNLLYQAVQDITAAIPVSGGMSLVAAGGNILSNAQAATPAAIAYRYALVSGNPFAVLGADYSAHNANGELDLYDPATGQGQLTDQYLTDRAGYLTAKLRDNTVDSASSTLKDVRYNDLDTTTVLNPINTELRKVTFGGAVDEGFSGSNGNDRLYGGGGSDALDGGAGADYLEGNTGNDDLAGGMGNDTLLGGAGLDTYHVGEGSDTILDSDGQGQLYLGADLLDGGESKDGGHTWQSSDGQHTYTIISGDINAAAGATIKIDNSLTLQHYHAGELGLTLNGAAAPQPAPVTNTITGDIAPDDTDPTKAGIQAARDAQGNLIGVAQPYEDILTGTAGADHILSGDLADNAGGGAGNDWIEGGAGSDYLNGNEGLDLIEGGLGADILAGDAGNDLLYGDTQIAAEQAIANGSTDAASGAKGDWLSGNAGDDQLVAGADNDILAGGGGNDLLIAGAGDDHILGDADYTPQFITETAPRYTVPAEGTSWYHTSSAPFDWTVTPGASGKATFAPATGALNPPDSGSDIIYAGAGADHVWAGAGGDVVYGEGGADTLDGEDGNDILFGGAGADTLYGDGTTANTGDDYLDGGDGADTLWGGNGSDILAGGAGDDKLYGEAGANYLEGGEGADTLNSGGPGSALYGGAGNDDLSAAGGGNTLDGGADNDTLATGGGNNTLDGGDGTNSLQATGNSNALFAGAGNDDLAAWGDGNYLDAGEGNNTLYAQGKNNELHAGAGNDTLQATGGNNRLDGGNGDNTLIADGGGNTLTGGAGNDSLSAAGGNSILDGGAGNDILVADTGGNTLIGGAGDDRLSAGKGGNNTLDGGDGLDTYIFDAGFGTNRLVDTNSNIAKFNFNFAGSGIVVGLGSLKLSFATGDELHIDNYDPNDPAGTCSIDTFQFDDQTLTLQNILDLGGPAVDFTRGPDITGTANADTLTGTDKAEHIYGLAGDDTITAGARGDIIEAGAGNDILDGGAGADVMKGGAGNDTYAVDNTADTLTENPDEGHDTVQSSVSHTLGANLENLILTGPSTGSGQAPADINGTGNALDNYLQGNAGNNLLSGGDGADQLDGGAGADTLSGGLGDDTLDGEAGADAMAGDAGNDTYFVDDAGDTATESANAGIDRVYSAVTHTLGANLENLVLTGTANIDGAGNDLDNRIDGNSGDNILQGGAGNDTFFGGGGTDTLMGGTGDDTYFVLGAGDNVTENANEGTDLVYSTINYTLTANVENLTLTGTGNIATGNALDNLITGNDQANALDGGAGADTMNGGYGNDTYHVDNAGDRAIENFVGMTYYSWGWPYTVQDIDTVNASVGYTLGNNLENLNLTGTADIGGTGNELDNLINGNGGNNTLSGNAGNDTLDGGAGADAMDGGVGGDTYYVDDAGDTVTETVAGQTYTGWQWVWTAYGRQYQQYTYIQPDSETVNSSVSFTLGANLENLNLTGDANIDGTGNELNNAINGNGGANILMGGAGRDWLDGGAGNDTLDGGAGDDTYTIGDIGDRVVEEAGNGYDRVYTNVDFALGGNVEFLSLNDGAIVGIGDDSNNTVEGNNAGNVLDGRAGRDFLDGRAGDDTISGGDGNDIIGGGYDGYVQDGNGWGLVGNSDMLDGGAGDDDINGGSGNDTISGGTGNDILFGGIDDGGEGADPLPNNDVVDGGEGDDNIDGGSGADTLYGGEGNDYVRGGDDSWNGYFFDYATQSYLAASSDDVLDGGNGDDILDGGSGADSLFGGAGDDVIYGGDNNSWGSETYDPVTGIYTAMSNDDYLDGGAGLDTLAGGQGGDVYVVDGSYARVAGVPAINDCGDPVPAERLVWTADTVTEYAGEGYDIVMSSAGYTLADNVEELRLTFDPAMAAGDPQRYADLQALGQDGTGNDLDNVIAGNALNNRLDGGLGMDTLEGGAGDDIYVVDQAGDTVIEHAGDGADTVESSISYSLDGTSLENLTLLDGAWDGRGNAADNVLQGNNTGNDLAGLEGNDKLVGGLGDDWLAGGAGNDRYVFRLGDGADVIDDSQGIDTLYIGNDLTAADISMERIGDDVLVSINNTADSITLVNWFVQAEGVKRVEFCDGSALENLFDQPPVAAPIADQVAYEDGQFSFTVPADAFADPEGGSLTYTAVRAGSTALPAWLTFDPAARTFSGTPDNWDVGALDVRVTATDSGGRVASSYFTLEVLNANDAPTVVNPLASQSVTEGQAFGLVVGDNAGAGDFMADATDTGTWNGTVNYLYGDAGDNILVGGGGTDYLYGDAGDDVLDGGAGDDFLEDDLGNDTYVFGRGYGKDVVYEWNGTAGNSDTVRFTADVLPADVSVYEDQSSSLVLSINGTGDSLRVDYWFGDDAAKVEQFVFADGTVWGVNDIMSIRAPLPAITAGDDNIAGTDGNDAIRALAGNDMVYGGVGDDLLLGGAGADELDGGTGSDILGGGSGQDWVRADGSYSDPGNDLLAGGAGDDYLGASVSNDLLIGEQGDDWLGDGDDNSGNNVALFNRGDGNDWLDTGHNGARSDTISLGGGIGYADMYFERGNWDNLILHAGNGESITIMNWFATWRDNRIVARLQAIVEAMPGYDPASSNPLLNKRIQQFDFAGLANLFEAALAADPTITTWQLAPHLADFSLGGSDTAAVGGDMAYLYGKNGNLGGLSEAEVRAQLNDAAFGTASQTLTSTSMGSEEIVFGDVDFMHGDSLTYSATLADGSALPGWLTFDAASGIFGGTPGSGDAGSLSVAVTATDSGGLSATSVFSLDVAGLNAAPVAAPDRVAVTEDETISTLFAAGLLANDTDPDAGDTLFVSGFDAVTAQGNAVAMDAAGDLVLDIGGRYQSLGAGQTADDSFTYTVSDAAGLASTAAVDVAITGVNDAPVAAAPIAGQQTNEDAPFSFTVPADTFTDIDNGDTLTFSVTLADGSALPGWLSFDAATRTFSGTPGNADVGSLNVLVTATDTGGLSATGAFVLDVLNVNDAPVAADDAVATHEDATTTSIAAADLLANDRDIDAGDAFTLTGFDAVSANGNAVVRDAAGNLVFDIGGRYQSLAAGQTATDSFGYTVTDAAGATSTATVTVTINGLNDSPVAQDDSVSLSEDATRVVGGNVLSNDSDADQGTVLGVANAGVVAGNYGSLALNADGSYSYTLDNALVQSLGAGQSVTETFAYQATDGIATTPATLTVTITGTNDAPVAAAPIAGQQTNEDAPFSFTVPAGTFTDIDNGDVLTYGATLPDGSALPGWLTFDAATQSFSGTPGNWDVGNYSVTVTATDTGGLSTSSTFAVDVANVNDAPTVSMALAGQSILEDAPFSFSVPASTFNDVDFIHGDTLTYSATLADGTALPGWLTFDAATQTFSGTPGNEDVGSLNVLVTATDTGGLSASSVFSLNVVNVNDTPTANADSGAATEDGGAVLLDAATLLANDTDPDFIHGDMLNIVGVSQAASGATVSLTNGAVQYNPSTSSGQGIGTLFQSLGQGQTATDTFSYTVSDTAGATSTATVTMTVTGVNDAPVTADDAAAVQEDVTLAATGNVLSNDTDVDQGTVLSVASAGALQGSYGSLVLNVDGSYVYTLDNASSAVQGLLAGQTVTETFAYQATDGIAATPAMLTVTITGANDAPLAQNDAAAIDEDSLLSIQSGALLANDTDADIGDTRTLAGVDAVSALGSNVSLVNGQAVYDHGGRFNSLMAGQTLTDSFGYTMIDSAGAASSAAVNVTITGVNDGPQASGDSAAMDEDTPQTILTAASLLANDTDPDAGDTLSIAGFDAVTALGNAVGMDAAGNLVFDPSTGSGQGNRYQYLAQGETITDTFNYTIIDTAGATSTAQVSMTITGINDAPVAVADTASVQEDLNITATGNVLANDSDVDQGTVLNVANAGTLQGNYGSLTLASDGSYGYAVDNASMTVQSLGRDAQAVEHFGYTATDGIAGTAAVLDVFLNGTNDAPILVAPLADQDFTFHKHFSWQVPDGSFIDIDQGDTLDYAATLADGSALPDWLSFDAATRTFSGETPKEVGFVDVRVIATDSVAATGSTAGSLSASDVFRISVSHGNEGVGNGEDAPPPGHDYNHNDGDGTSPGRPGRRGGNGHPSASAEHPHGNEPQEHSSDDEASHGDVYARASEDSGGDRTDELIRAWFEEESISEQYSSFGALDRHGAWGGQIDWQVNRNVSEGISVDVSSEWERMNAQLRKHLEQTGGDEGIFAEPGAGSRPFGLFGSGGNQGIPQLGMGSGQQMKAFAGLNEGLERLGC